MDLLSAFERVSVIAKDSKFNDEFFKAVEPELRYIGEMLDLPEQESALLSVFMEFASGKILLSRAADYIGSTRIFAVKLMKYADLLVEREYVNRVRESESVHYNIPLDVIEAFKDNKRPMPKRIDNLSASELFKEFSKLFNKCEQGKITPFELLEKVKALVNANVQLDFCGTVVGLGLSNEDMLLLVLFCHLFVTNHDDAVRFGDLYFAFSESVWNVMHKDLSYGENVLQVNNFIEHNSDFGFTDHETFRLNYDAKKLLLSELNIKLSRQTGTRRAGLLYPEDIKEKELFFNDEVKEHFDDMRSLLMEENYRSVMERLESAGLPRGLTCLFYGAPGTGKTELVHQLARITRRPIHQVDFAQLKSKWVGESEKNVKEVFDKYKQMCRELPVTPILLFNEADSIIGRRFESVDYSVEKMENTIQNIILQEMETFEGIMIATTNLVQSFDKAFERRFLYKIKFARPDLPTRVKIWQSHLPAIDLSVVEYLARKYDFTGGQISNIARHFFIDNILHNDDSHIKERLESHCVNEVFETRDAKRVGYV